MCIRDRTRALLSTIERGQTVGILIGPEGGLEKSEVAAAMEAGIHPITLGKRILRTETAGLCILSVLMFQDVYKRQCPSCGKAFLPGKPVF